MTRQDLIQSRLIRTAALLGLPMALIGACAGTSDDGERCTPGESVSCVGPAGCQGGQVCAEDGSRFLECQCDQAGSGGDGGPNGGGNGGPSNGMAGASSGGGAAPQDDGGKETGPPPDTGLDPRVRVATEGPACEDVGLRCEASGTPHGLCRFASATEALCESSKCATAADECLGMGEPCRQSADCTHRLHCFDNICAPVCDLDVVACDVDFNRWPGTVCTNIGHHAFGVCLTMDGEIP